MIYEIRELTTCNREVFPSPVWWREDQGFCHMQACRAQQGGLSLSRMVEEIRAFTIYEISELTKCNKEVFPLSVWSRRAGLVRYVRWTFL